MCSQDVDFIRKPFVIPLATLIENVLQQGTTVANIDHQLFKIAGLRIRLIFITHFDVSLPEIKLSIKVLSIECRG